MAAFDFPASPTNGQSYTANGVTYTYSAADQAWIGGPIADPGIWQPIDPNLTALAGLADNAVGFPYLDGAGGAQPVNGATSAEFQAGSATRLLENTAVWNAAALVTLSYGATTTPTMTAGINFALAATGAVVLANPVANPPAGRSGVIVITPTGDQTITFGSNWLFPNAAKPTALQNGKPTAIFYFHAGSGVYLCGAGEAYA